MKFHYNRLSSFIQENIQNILLVFLLLAVLPFLLLSFYTQPFYDDFKVFPYSDNLGFVAFFEFWYQGWTGAYTTITLWFFTNPLIYDSFFGFRLIPFAYILINFLAVFSFVSVFVRKLKLKLILSLAFVVLYLNQAPALNETLYWYVGATGYYFTPTFFIFFYALFVRFFSQKKYLWTYCLLMLLSAAIAGTIPFLIVFHVGLLILFTINTFFKFPEKSYYVLALLLVTIVLAVVNLGATGGIVRMQTVASGLDKKGEMLNQDMLKLFIMSGYYLLHHLGNWLSSGLLLLASFFFIPVAYSLEKRFKIKSKLIISHPFLFLTGVIFMLYVFNVIIGYLHAPAPRIWNIFFLMFLISWFVFIQLLVTHYINHQSFIKFIAVYKARQVLILLKIVWLVLLFVPSHYNIHNAYYDLVFVAPLYEKAMQNRYAILWEAKKNKKQEVSLPILSVKETSVIMFIDDIRVSPDYHLNNLYEQYFGIKKVKGIKQN